MRETFIVYTEHIEDVEELTDAEAGMLLKALLAYNAEETLPDNLPGVVRILFKNMRREMDYTHNRYEERRRKRSEAGKKAMESRWGGEEKRTEAVEQTTADNKNNNVIFRNSKNNLTDTDTVTDTVTVSAKADKKRMGNADALPAHTRKTIPPTVQEVRAYCLERRNGIDAEHFCNYYAARGWELSRGRKMKDWQAAVRTWEHHGHGRDAPGIRANPFLDMLREEGLYDTGGDDQNAGDSAPGIPAGTGS
jgi:hypothetical protein